MTASVDRSDVLLESSSPDVTRSIGEEFGRVLRPGDVVVLEGDLGAGKTTFTQGLARGMGIGDAVTSPTFVMARELGREEGSIALTHVDAYRLTSLGEWDDLDIDAENSVVVIEWGERIEDALPLDRVHVRLTETGDARALRIWAPDGSRRRLFDAIRAVVA
jgi:tRNA threonylcarbamoyladenosine biosynthesis protein TsaE